MPTDAAKIGAATFIRDLYYKPTLRDKYFQALKTVPQRRASSVNAILKDYHCTIDDLGAGWATLQNQSFLAWQSVYTLRSKTESADNHTVTIVGSRTGKTTVLFDGVAISGYKATFTTGRSTDLPTVTWSADSSNGYPKNVILQLDHVVPSASTLPGGTVGDRVINAKIWDPKDTTPADFTHTGLDFFSDMGMFNGSYDTLTTDPDSGDQVDSYPATVKVNLTNPSEGSAVATVDLSIKDDNNNVLKVGSGLQTDRDEIQWLTANNVSTKWPDDANVQTWRQGYLSFSWEYIPPKASGTGTTKAEMKQRFNGSVWLDSMDNSVQIDGNIQPESLPSDVKDTVAVAVGAVVSVGIFLLVGVGIYKSVRSLVDWAKKKFAADDRQARGQSLNQEEMAEVQRADQVVTNADLVTRVDPVVAVDSRDPTTFKEKVNPNNGEKEVSYRGEKVYENPLDATTTISDLHVPGETALSKEVTDLRGQPIKDLERLPVLKSPITNIELNETMVIKQVGNVFTTAVEINEKECLRAVTGEGEFMRTHEEERLHLKD